MLKLVTIVGSAICLVLCLASPILYFLGRIGQEGYKSVLIWSSLGWFVGAAILAFRRK